MTSDKRIHLAVAVLLALGFSLAVSPSAARAQSTAQTAVSAFGGFTTDPGGFDVFRQTSFDGAYHAGGVLSFRMSENLAIRGDVSRAWTSGEETGAINEPVEFDRTYYGVELEGRLPLGGITPYAFGGGGMVSVDRTAETLEYDFTTFGAKLGGGLSHAFSGAPVEVFVEGSGWFYDRVTTGQGMQVDTSVSGGITFVPEF